MTGVRVPRLGAVVAWWDGGHLVFGVAAGEERDRIRLVVGRGKQERVKLARLAVETEERVELSEDTLEARRVAGERLAEVAERIRARAAGVDVATLWEIVGEDGGEATTARSLDELAELGLDSAEGTARAATILALVEDGVHFVRKGDSFMPRSGKAVDELLHERARVRQREVETDEFFDALARAVGGEDFVATGSSMERRSLEALERLALEDDAADDTTRELAVESLQAVKLRFDRPHEGAFRLLRRLGRFDSDDQNLQVLRYGLRTRFPEEVLAHARGRVEVGFVSEGRQDLTGLSAFSIDSPHTREIDDLLSIIELDSGGCRVGVHIADPAAFVEPDDPVDAEALLRGLTHYMPDVRLPMLPPAISEDAASLVPGKERPALSFLADLDAEGQIVSFEIVRSVVRSVGRLDYSAADRTIAGEDAELAAELRRLAAMATSRCAARTRAGAVTIRAPEAEVHVDQGGRPVLDRLPAESPSRWAVTEAMVLAGALAARFALDAGLSVTFRRQAAGDGVAPAPDVEWDPVLIRRVRRSLRRADVGLEPGPHASLGLDAYVQASSPIRRFQDLANHRQILSSLAGVGPCYDREAMQRIASTTDRADLEARRAERATEVYWMLRYLEERIGQVADAVVVDVQPRPVIQLTETLWEQPMNALSGVELGECVRLRIERVNPRAGLLVLRREG